MDFFVVHSLNTSAIHDMFCVKRNLKKKNLFSERSQVSAGTGFLGLNAIVSKEISLVSVLQAFLRGFFNSINPLFLQVFVHTYCGVFFWER